MTQRSATDVSAPCAFVVVGANHRSSGPELRDRIFVAADETRAMLRHLVAGGVPQCLVMSTCDRVEIQAAAPDPDAAGALIRDAMSRRAKGLAAGEPFYVLTGDAAVRHVFAVAAGLDSVVVGESQVLGQLRQAHRDSGDAGCVGSELESLLQAAYTAAKDVRSNTAIAEGPVSMAAAAVRVARDLHGDIADTTGLLVGGGDMGVLLLEQFRNAGMADLTVCASSRALAENMARGFGAHAATLDDLEYCLARADIIVAATGLGHFLITADMMREALRRRRRKPMFAIDAAVPGDIDPLVDHLDDAFRYDLDDLEAVAERNRGSRLAAADAAWAIVDRHAAAFASARRGRRAAPTVVQLRERFEAIRRDVLAANGLADAEEATRRLVGRLLHEPSQALRDAAAGGDPDAIEAAVRVLFRLENIDANDAAIPCDGDADRKDER
jgi:glutamyl-tRNA reductase